MKKKHDDKKYVVWRSETIYGDDGTYEKSDLDDVRQELKDKLTEMEMEFLYDPAIDDDTCMHDWCLIGESYD